MRPRTLRLVVLAALVGGLWFVLRDRPAEVAVTSRSPAALKRAPQKRWTSPALVTGSLKLRGRIVGPNGPVAGARIVAAVSDASDDLWLQTCNSEGDLLLGSSCHHASLQLNALVEARKAGSLSMVETKSGAGGEFEFDALGDATFALWIESEPGGAFVDDLKPSLDPPILEIAVGQSLVFEGRVVGPHESPIAGALVTAMLIRKNHFFEVITGADGRFRFDAVPDGEYVVIASRDGQFPEFVWLDENRDDIVLELEPPQRLFGRVVRRGRPAARVDVRAEQFGSLKFAVRADGEGRFAFEELRRGQWEVVALARNESARALVELFEDPEPADELVLDLAPFGGITGLITDAAGQPVGDAEVKADNERRTRTGADGRYTLAPLRWGSSRINVSATGHPSRHAIVSVPADSLATLDLRLEAAEFIRGMVVDDLGSPVENVQVSAHDSGDDQWRDSAPTTKDGRFVIENLTRGPHDLKASAKDLMPFATTATAPSEGVRIVLARGGSLTGRVLDARGSPMPHIHVSLESRWADVDPRARSAADGSFTMRDLVGGAHTASATDSETGERVETPFTVAPGRTTTIELRFPAGLELAGRVVGPEGKPVEGARVFAEEVNKSKSYEERSHRSAVAAADGSFRIGGLAPATYDVHAGARDFDDSEHISTPAGVAGLDLRLAATHWIRGRVVDGEGRPAVAFTVDGRSGEVDGRFEIDRESAHSVLTFKAPLFAQKDVSLEGYPPGDLVLPDVVLEAGRTIEGLVVDASTGDPVATAEVVFWADSAESVGSSMRPKGSPTNGRGAFTLRHVPSVAGALAVRGDTMMTTTVPLDARATKATIRVVVGGRLEVTVLAANGDPVPGAGVHVVSEASGMTGSRADYAGLARFAGLAPGRNTVMVDHRAYSSNTRVGGSRADVTIVSGETAQLEVREPSGGVDVHLDFVGAVPADNTLFALLLRADTPLPPASREPLLPLLVLAAASGTSTDPLHHVAPGAYTLFLCRLTECHQRAVTVGQTPITVSVSLPTSLRRGRY